MTPKQQVLNHRRDAYAWRHTDNERWVIYVPAEGGNGHVCLARHYNIRRAWALAAERIRYAQEA